MDRATAGREAGGIRVDEDAQLASAARGTEEATIGDEEREEQAAFCWLDVSMETEAACKGVDAICERWTPILSAEVEGCDCRTCEEELLVSKGTLGLETAAEMM